MDAAQTTTSLMPATSTITTNSTLPQIQIHHPPFTGPFTGDPNQPQQQHPHSTITPHVQTHHQPIHICYSATSGSSGVVEPTNTTLILPAPNGQVFGPSVLVPIGPPGTPFPAYTNGTTAFHTAQQLVPPPTVAVQSATAQTDVVPSPVPDPAVTATTAATPGAERWRRMQQLQQINLYICFILSLSFISIYNRRLAVNAHLFVYCQRALSFLFLQRNKTKVM